ncbi:hypothetical protein Dimus_002120 [Dionaea muscipula]
MKRNKKGPLFLRDVAVVFRVPKANCYLTFSGFFFLFFRYYCFFLLLIYSLMLALQIWKAIDLVGDFSYPRSSTVTTRFFKYRDNFLLEKYHNCIMFSNL